MNRLAKAVFFLGFAACGPGAPMMVKVDPPTDVRVLAPKADPAYIDMLAGEQTIGPGVSVMFCTHLTYTGDEAAFNNLVMDQGKFGHHVVLLGAKYPKPNGTVEDCSDPKDMAKFDVFGILGDELPAGHGSHLHKGMALVLQSHYINTSTHSILVRDVVRVHTIPVSSVTVWGSAFVNNNLDFTLVPHGSAPAVISDCVVPDDVDIMEMGGHLHELGATFETLVGPDVDHLTSVYKVDQWKPEYRDAPPILLNYTTPMHWAKGTVVRTKCSWNNTTDHAVTFPEEMCVTFGYADGITAAWNCLAKTAQ